MHDFCLLIRNSLIHSHTCLCLSELILLWENFEGLLLRDLRSLSNLGLLYRHHVLRLRTTIHELIYLRLWWNTLLAHVLLHHLTRLLRILQFQQLKVGLSRIWSRINSQGGLRSHTLRRDLLLRRLRFLFFLAFSLLNWLHWFNRLLRLSRLDGNTLFRLSDDLCSSLHREFCQFFLLVNSNFINLFGH